MKSARGWGTDEYVTAVVVESGGLWNLLSQKRGKNKTERVLCAGESWGSPYSIYGAYNLST